jgi:hypothetical protein
MEHRSRTTGRRTTRWALVGGIALIAVSVMTFTAFSAFTGYDTEDTAINSGTMAVSISDPGAGVYLNIGASDIAPGDSIERLADVSITGSVSATNMKLTTYDVADAGGDESQTAGDSLLFTNDANGLQLLIQRCAAAWDTSSHPYTCAGGALGVYATAPVNDASATTLTNTLVSAGSTNHYRILMTFPGGAGDSYQGLSATIRFKFSLTQRAGTYIDS